MEKYALIVAGGSGSRMGSVVPKQFMLIAGKTVLMHTVDAFKLAYPDIHFILVLPEMYLKQGYDLFIEAEFDLSKIKIVAGGATRFHSVQNGLKLVEDDAIVFIHDAVRCLITTDLIRRCFEMAILNGSAIPAIPVRDSIREINSGGLSIAINREKLRIIQTPQTFQAGIIKRAFNCEYRDDFTDEASVLEYKGIIPHLVEGEQSNIKITFKEDIAFIEWKLMKLT